TQDETYLAAYGWKGARGDNWWRTGTLSGTSCFVYRKDNGYTYAVILNSSVWMGHRFNNYIKIMMDNAIQHLDTQSDIDLFWQNKPSENLLPNI
ncbi:MAG: hypothetical protein R3321_14525, partial [Nitrososphaeraceae archaeon]|nr:hypothetical protein [Nitrososphaeraceae archaeon]